MEESSVVVYLAQNKMLANSFQHPLSFLFMPVTYLIKYKIILSYNPKNTSDSY